MPALTAASCDPSDDGRREDWTIVVLRRDGAPPIRFSGREIVRSRDGALAVGIWQTRTGGFVLSRSIGDGTGEVADRHATEEETMTALETFCRAMDTLLARPPDGRLAERLEVADLVEELAIRADRRRRFRILAGQALDTFDAWSVGQRVKDAGGGT